MAYDVIVIGGGIVGLASAFQISRRHPGFRLMVVEKERELAFHQTGRNSGVMHSGIYYKPGSLKAQNCRMGKRMLEEFCLGENIPMMRCGKVIVATSAEEVPRLEALYQRGIENGVDCELVDVGRLHDLEPHVKGIRGIHVRETGIINYRTVCERLADILRSAGHSIRLGVEVLRMDRRGTEVRVVTSSDELVGAHVVNCGGLQSDRLADMSGQIADCRIVPFRGEYFRLTPEAEDLCRNLIYPVPNPEFPFLGVHFTRMIDGGVECGPNAVLAWAREGYGKTDFNCRDMKDLVRFGGFWKMGRQVWRMGMEEYWRSWNKKAFVKALQRLIPEIRGEQLEPAPAGIRAQAVGRDGRIVDDFVISRDARIINVINAPSPAATASLAIGDHVAGLLQKT